ncbi:MAG: LamG-like jellyroll fold domain-containing protein [Bacteroidales bacterium]
MGILQFKSIVFIIIFVCLPHFISANILLHEDFSSGSTPSGWTNTAIQGSQNWTIQSSPAMSSTSGGYYAVFDDYALGASVTPNEASLATASFDCTGHSLVKINYEHYWEGVEGTHAYVEISTDGGTNWSIITEYTNSTSGSLAAPADITSDISAWAANEADVQIRFRYSDGGFAGKYWYIDDITVYSDPDVGATKLVEPAPLDCGESFSNAETITVRIENYSHEDISNVPVVVEITGGITQTLNETITGPIPAESSVEHTFATTVDFSTDAAYHVHAYTNLSTDAFTDNDEHYSGRHQLVQSYPYSEDFNAGKGGWFSGMSNPPDNNGRHFTWGAVPYLNGAEGEGNSWFIEIDAGADNYKADWFWVESPVFDFSENTNPVLSFDIKHSLHSYYRNEVFVQYSLDGGSNWSQLGSGPDPQWYNESNEWNDSESNPVNTWTHMEHDLCELSGEDCVKFRIKSKAYYNNPGRYYFAFDNIEISAGESDDIQPLAITLPDGNDCTGYSSTETVQIIVKNNRCRPLYNVPVSLQVNGGTVINETIPGPVNRFDTYIYTFTNTIDLSATGTHNILVATNFATDDDASNDQIEEVRINNPINTYPYEEDFNADNGGWVSHTNAHYRYFLRGEVPYLNGAEGEGNSWYVDMPDEYQYKSDWFQVESPVFDLSSVSNPMLFMDIKHSLHSYYRCEFFVQYSLDGGSSWTQLGSGSDPNWYNDPNEWNNSQSNPVDYWKTVQHDLCNLVGESCVKFRINGRAYYNDEGRYNFAFDNFKIVDEPEAGVIAMSEPNATASGCLYSTNQHVTITVQNYGCAPLNDVPVTCEIDLPATHPMAPQLTFNGVVSSIPATGTTDYTFTSTFDMTPMGDYQFTSYTSLAGDVNNENDTVNVDISVDFPKVSSFPYFEDFNADEGFWTPGMSNPPDNNGRHFTWGAVPYLNGAEGEGNSWFIEIDAGADNYKADWFWVESPVFDFSENTNPVLSFDIKHSLHSYYRNEVFVQYSLDGGSNWSQLGSGPDPQWYNESNEWNDSESNPVNTWTHMEHDLCELSGEDCVKFRIKSKAYYNNPGRYYFAFDNIEISAGESDDIQPLAITLPDGNDCTGYSSTETVQIIVKNNRCRPLYNVPVSLQVNGGTVINETIPGPVNRFDTYIYTFTNTIDLSATGTHNILVATNFATDDDASNDQIEEVRINNPINTYPYEEDFNADNGGWVSHTNAHYRYFLRGEVPYLNGAEGEGNSWYVDMPDEYQYKSDWFQVESPVFDLSSVSNPMLFMDIKHSLHSYYRCEFFVQYSLDGGSSWTQLGSGSDPNWYNDPNEWNNSQSNPVDYWKTVQHDLCNLVGESCVKFRINGRAYYNDEGRYNFAFDNFKIVDAPDVGVIGLNQPDINANGCLYSGTQEVNIEVYNYSCTEAVDVPVQVDISLPAGHPDAPSVSLNGTVPSVPAQTSVSYTLPANFNMLPVGDYDFDAYTQLAGDNNSGNDHFLQAILVEFPRISSYPYEEDFNSDQGYWLSKMSNPPDNNGRHFTWGAVPYLNGAEGEDNSWFIEIDAGADNYKADWFWVESPVFDFTGISSPVLYMDIKHSLHSYYRNEVYVQYSLDGGYNWSTLGSGSDPNWYNESNEWNNSQSNPVDYWQRVQHELCSFAGESCVRFRIRSRAYYNNDDRYYFAFDNFKIIDGQNDISVNEFIYPRQNDEYCTFNDAEQITVKITNPTCNEIVDIPMVCEIDGQINQVLNGTLTIPALSDTLYTFPATVDMRQLGDYNFTVYSSLGTDINNSNDSIYQSIIVNDTIITSLPYYESFDNGEHYWRAEVSNPPDNNGRHFTLGNPPYLNGSEGHGNSWFIDIDTGSDNYKADWIYLESPVFDFSGVQHPLFSMKIKHSLHSYYRSEVYVQYSIDGGANWSQLGSGSDPNWYNDPNEWNNSQSNPVENWQLVRQALCQLKGESCVKFRIKGRAYYNNPDRYYFAFDDIQITDSPVDASPDFCYSCHGSEYEMEVDVENVIVPCQFYDACNFDSGHALDFDGNDDYVAIENLYYDNTNYTEATVEAWIKTSDSGNQIIASFDRSEYWRLEVNGQAGNGEIGWDVATDSGIEDLASNTRIDDGQWHHVAGVFDNGDLRIYIDGILDATATRGSVMGTGTTRYGFISTGSEASSYNGSHSGSAFNGQIDELRIWNIAKTETEIRASMCGGLTGTESGLIAYYQMEDGGAKSSVLSDITGNGYHGNLINMDPANDWPVSNLSANNNGVASEQDDITSLEVIYSINGQPPVSHLLSAPADFNSIAPGTIETVIVPGTTIPDNTSDIQVWVKSPNTETDQVVNNDTIATTAIDYPNCNDHCSNAIDLTTGVLTTSQTSNATTDIAEDPSFSGCGSVTLENTVWYTFTTTGDGDVNITFQNTACSPSTNGLQVSINEISGDPCDPANYTEVFCEAPGDQSEIIWDGTDLPANTTYLIAVDGYANNDCDFEMDVTGNVPLPVELLFFKAEKDDNFVDVSWKTASELNNDFFVVEKSKDAQHFISFDTIQGQGTTSSITNYFTTDKNPFNGRSYYRLKQVDFDGSYTYSAIANVLFESVNEVRLFPNPADKELNLYMESESEQITMTLINAAGQDVLKENTPLDDGRLHKIVKTASYKPGLYMLFLHDTNSGSMLHSEKIVITHGF